MNEAVSSIKNWTLRRISKRNLQAPTNGGEQKRDSISREQMLHNHRYKRARLWALQIQAECYLMSSLLQIVGSAESWTAIVKLGYSLRKTWTLYQHCLHKLRQITREWIAMGGSFDLSIGLSMEGGQTSSSDSGDEECINNTEIANGLHRSDSASLDFAKNSPGTSTSGWETQSTSNIFSSTHVESKDEIGLIELRTCQLLVLDTKTGVREDAEMSSLRIGLQFGEGAFNVIVSLIPSSFRKAIEVMRFPADREKGIWLLQRVSTTYHPRAPLASLMLLYYHTVIMGLLPFSPEQAKVSHSVIDSFPSTWRSCSFYCILCSRLERYERHLHEATASLTLVTENTYTLDGPGNIRKLRSLMLDELGWCHLLRGEFVQAADCFNKLLKETVCFKPFYACLQSACLWESEESFQDQAGDLLKDMPMLVGSRKQQQLAPVEQYALRMSNAYIDSNQAPLFPALELAAVYNGFQFMDKITLERHKRSVEDVLQGRSQTHKKPEITQDAKVKNEGTANTQDLLINETLRMPPMGATIRPRLHYEHKWTKSSKMICRFLIGLCQKNLGEQEKADDNFRYVISNSEVYCSNIVPYSCYELASMLLQQDASSTEGLKLLEQCVNYPPHEFQGRLKFVVGELSRKYGDSPPPVCDSSTLADGQQGQQGPPGGGSSFSRVSGQILKGLARRESGKA